VFHVSRATPSSHRGFYHVKGTHRSSVSSHSHERPW